MKDLNEQTRIIKLLKESPGVILHDLGSGRDFLDVTHKARVIKEKTGQLDLRRPRLKRERQATDWKTQVQATYLIRDLYPEYIRNPYNSVINNPNKVDKYWSRNVLKEDTEMAVTSPSLGPTGGSRSPSCSTVTTQPERLLKTHLQNKPREGQGTEACLPVRQMRSSPAAERHSPTAPRQ